MGKYNFEINSIYCEDNRIILPDFPNECVDLIYIDPPF
jgi:DNA modification methylase